jgi:HK97 family phage portal protein
MGFVANALQRWGARAAVPLSEPRVTVSGRFSGDSTGMNLSEREVLGWPVVLQAMRVMSWSLASLPCHIYERTEDGLEKLAADDHRLRWVLHEEPHPEYTPFEFMSAVVFNALFRGNFFGYIMTDWAGEVECIVPLVTSRMQVDRPNDAIRYRYRTEDGEVYTLPASEVLHIKGFNDGGVLGYALNEIAPNTFAKGVAMDRFGARVFKNGMTGGAVIEAEQPFKFNNDDEKKRFYDKIQESMSGQDNWHRVIGLPYGMKMKNLGVSAKDAQLIEGLTFQVQDVARLTGIPPTLLMDLSRATFTNSEQQMLQFVQLTLGPWIVNIEQALMAKLLSREERKKYKIKFLVDALLRADLKTQSEALAVAVGGPWMTLNEARRLKELSPLEGGNEVARPQKTRGAGAPGG